jgi:hypothetical protein
MIQPPHLALAGGSLAAVVGALTLIFGYENGAPVVLSGALGIAGGGVALLGHRRLPFLAGADGMVALALTAAMFGWGLAQIPALLVLMVATAMTPPGRPAARKREEAPADAFPAVPGRPPAQPPARPAEGPEAPPQPPTSRRAAG